MPRISGCGCFGLGVGVSEEPRTATTTGGGQGMPGRRALNIQGGFLVGALKEENEVAVALTTGKFFKGRVKRFDRYAVVFETPKECMLVYKHAIVSIVEDLSVAAARESRQTGRLRRPPVGGPRRAASSWQR